MGGKVFLCLVFLSLSAWIHGQTKNNDRDGSMGTGDCLESLEEKRPNLSLSQF